MGTISGKYKLLELDKYREIFKSENCTFTTPQYMLFQARGGNFIASFYSSGKYVIQGQGAEQIAGKHFNFCSNQPKKIIVPYPHIGVDESGKGDFLGPLVIAGTYLDENRAKLLSELGAVDSKKLNDKKILQLAVKIKENSIFDVIVITPKKYNELYSSFKNLNKLLAWGHSTVIENILSKIDCKRALCDKFADENVIKNALKTKGREIDVIQMTKAEEDTAVACASILARAEFVNRMEKMSKHYEIKLPKGANSLVINAAKNISIKFGKNELENICKKHFKSYREI